MRSTTTGPFSSRPKSHDGISWYTTELIRSVDRSDSWSLDPCVQIAPTNDTLDLQIAVGAHLDNGNTDHATSDTMFSNICAVYVSILAENEEERIVSTSKPMVSLSTMFPAFLEKHCHSSTMIAVLGVTELACLALLLAHTHALPHHTYFKNLTIKLFEKQMHENLISGLLVIMNNTSTNTSHPSTQPSQFQQASTSSSGPTVDVSALRISLAVASLAHLLDGHVMVDSLLTDANISQLLRLAVSKAVYPSHVSSSSFADQTGRNTLSSYGNNDIALCGMSQLWEIAFCRTALRRLLQVPAVIASEATVDEAFTFVSKWWSRLQKAATDPATSAAGNGAIRTPGKLSRYAVPVSEPSHHGPSVPVVPAVRTALEVILDFYKTLPQIRDYVRQTVLGNSAVAGSSHGLSFMTSYIRSVDPRTAFIAARFVALVLRDISVDTTSNRVLVRDASALVACSCEHLQYIIATINDAPQRSTIDKGHRSSLGLRDVTNTPGASDALDAANSVLKRGAAALTAAAARTPTTSEVASSSSIRIVLVPVIGSLSKLLLACLHSNQWSNPPSDSTMQHIAIITASLASVDALMSPEASSKASRYTAKVVTTCVRLLVQSCIDISNTQSPPLEGGAAAVDLVIAKLRCLLLGNHLGPSCLLRMLLSCGIDLVTGSSHRQEDVSVVNWLMQHCLSRDHDDGTSESKLVDQSNSSTTFLGSTELEMHANDPTTAVVSASAAVRFAVASYGSQGSGESVGDESEGDAFSALNLTVLTHNRPAVTTSSMTTRRSHQLQQNNDTPPQNSQQINRNTLFNTPADSATRVRHELTLAAAAAAAVVADIQHVDDSDCTDSITNGHDEEPEGQGHGDSAMNMVHNEEVEEQNDDDDDMTQDIISPFRTRTAYASPQHDNTNNKPSSSSHPPTVVHIDNDDKDKGNMSIATNTSDGADSGMDVEVARQQGQEGLAFATTAATSSNKKTNGNSGRPLPALSESSGSSADSIIDHATLRSQIAFLESETANAKALVASLRADRDAMTTEAHNLRSLMEVATVDAAGQCAVTEEVDRELHRLRQQNRQLDEARVRAEAMAVESNEQREQMEVMMQEAWTKLSELAKTEATLEADKNRLTQIVESTTTELLSCQGDLHRTVTTEQQATARAQLLVTQLASLQQEIGNLLFTTNELQDKVNDRTTYADAIFAQLGVAQSSLDKETRRHDQSRHRLEIQIGLVEEQRMEIELWRTQLAEAETSKSRIQQQLTNNLKATAELQSKLQRTEAELVKESTAHSQRRQECERQIDTINDLQRTVEETGRLVEHWRAQFTSEHEALTKIQELEVQLRDEIKSANTRATTAQRELSKHRELISYINQLSAGAEGEAGKDKARRLSLALSQETHEQESVDMDVDTCGITAKPTKNNSNPSQVPKKGSRRSGSDSVVLTTGSGSIEDTQMKK